jgi:putative methanogen marker protein 4
MERGMWNAESLIASGLPEVTVGIGSSADSDCVESSAEAMGAIVYRDADELVSDLVSGRIDAAVRGNMSSSLLLPKLRRALGLSYLERSVLLEPAGGKMFFLAPVGVDEGWTVDQKVDIAVRTVSLMRRIGMGERIAVMSGGRSEDMGRHRMVDRTIEDAGEVVKALRGKGYDAYDAEILLESAASEADLIIAPDGISGNIIFRALHFLGGAAALGAPLVNSERIYVDTSRAKTDYRDSIVLAMKLTEGRK